MDHHSCLAVSLVLHFPVSVFPILFSALPRAGNQLVGQDGVPRGEDPSLVYAFQNVREGLAQYYLEMKIFTIMRFKKVKKYIKMQASLTSIRK